MDKNDLPLVLGFARAQNPEALRAFSLLPEEKRSQIVQQAHSVSSKSEMQSLVNGLSASD